MSNNLIIRNFQANDREALRQICVDAADRGRPIENFFSDRLIAADILTGYYTDYEPTSSFVAQVDGRVVGYINGCVDNRRWGLVMFWILIPRVIIKAFKRGVFFHRESWCLIYAGLLNWRRLFSWRKNEFHSHQGHLHIGIAQDFRGQHIGGQLVDALCVYAKAQGCLQLIASVHDGNIGACHFFQRHGFTIDERYDMVAFRAGVLEHYQALVYVKNLK